MKAKSLYLAVLLLGLLSWNCSNKDGLKTSSDSVSLKSSLKSGVQELTTAVNTISTSAGYQVLASTDLTTKSAELSYLDTITHSILLADIAGVYDYKANTFMREHMSIMRFFNKTGESSQMIVRLPEEKVKSWRSLLHFSAADTLLTNNYEVNISDYQYNFKRYVGYDYSMASAIKIKNTDAGVLKIQSSKNKTYGYTYASEFAFPNGYVIKCQYSSGDTATSVYAITDGAKTLYEEKYTAIKSNTEMRHREKEFSLTIGDVLITRSMNKEQSHLDSAKVYVGGVLQLHSKVELVDLTTGTTNDADEIDRCISNKKRELQITFDDGTVSTFTELAGTVVTDISTLFTSMKQVNFAINIVDWIAWDIYTNK
ncbi:MAG TPA: hypothetical protein VFC67_16225 [Prolixibacteraceae bacterium]|nr:hypothetical protein [Prolixibacteraceae bacterium]